METFKLIYVESDNFEGYLTERAYKELTLQMSTGDFHMHKHSELYCRIGSEVIYYDLDEFSELLDYVA